jgi:hypothetical protein
MLRTSYDDDQCISLADFKEAVLQRVDPEKPETMMLVGRELVQLSNNKNLLSELFAKQLHLWQHGAFSMYSPQSAVLASFGRFLIRANFWPVLPEDPRRRLVLGQLLSYFGFHDHNFSFLTTHFFGPGYETDLYSYGDYDGVEGFIGERVDLNYEGRFRLGRGDVFLYQQGVDIHSQNPPTDMSSSLNLMIKEAGGASTEEQYSFDVTTSTISRYVDSTGHKQNSLLGFCRTLGDASTARRVERLAAEHPSKSMRAFACATLGVLSDRMEIDADVLRKATEDRSRLVRESSQKALAHVEG